MKPVRDPSEILRKQFEIYLEKQEEFVAKYDGKVIVIKDGEVLGVYDSELEAVAKTKVDHELGTFLVQRVSSGDDDYAQHYQSRAVFT